MSRGFGQSELKPSFTSSLHRRQYSLPGPRVR